MSGIQIVAVLGSSAAGKSTVAQYLVERHGFTRVRFAQPLKDMLMSIGVTREQVDGPQSIRERPSELLCGRSPRYAMQMLGTEFRDLIDRTLWARITRKRITDLIAQGFTKFVIDDMRFPHEAEMFREIGAVIIAVRRPEVEPTKFQRIWSRVPMPKIVRTFARLLFDIKTFHISETAWFGIERDTDLDNTGSLDDLYHSVDGIVE
jgi:dephospho-CoA kinase